MCCCNTNICLTFSSVCVEYFETTEEYEKCSELLELLNAKKSADFDMFLDNLASDNGITIY